MIRILCIAWILGISCIGLTQPFFSYFHPSLWWAVLAVGVGIYGILWQKNVAHGWQRMCLCVAAVAMFACACGFADQQLQQRLDRQVKQKQAIEGVVYIKKLPEGKVENGRQVAELLLPQHRETIQILLYPKRIYNNEGQIIGQSTDVLKIGHFYQVTVELKPPYGNVNEGTFDSEKWLLQSDIQGIATLLYSEELTAKEIQAKGWYQFVVQQQQWLPRWQLWIEQLRLRYRQQLLTVPVDDEKALLLALLTGDRSGISREMTQRYQYLGISHLLAISGPHVLILATLVSGILMWLLHGAIRRQWLPPIYRYISKQKLYVPIFMLCVTFYAAFSGFDIPAMRTWLIAMLCSMALLLNIRLSALTVLLLAAALVLWWDCFAILSAGFWLSFGASGILLMIYQTIQQQQTVPEHIWEKVQHWVHLLWQSQWRISLALVPIVMWQFQALSLMSPLVNLLAIPFLSLIIVPLDIIAATIWQIIPPLGEGLWQLTALLLAIFNGILAWLEPLARLFYLPSYLTVVGLCSLTAIIAILMLPKGLIPRYWAAFFCLPLLMQQGQRPMLQLDVLDVGQGQAVVLRSRHHQMVIDTGMAGWTENAPSMGDKVVVPFLRSQGIFRLDEVMLSHWDLDHSGGTAAVVEQLKVAQIRSNIADSSLNKFAKIPFITCRQGQQWDWDGVHIEILYPQADDPHDNANESSCVMLIRAPMQGQDFKILLMGDVGWEGEYRLLQRFPDLTADILLLGHHGSKHSSAYDFLAQINPKLAVISVGMDNRYGHPTAEVKARLQDLNIASVTTMDYGAVHIELAKPTAVWTWRYERAKRKWLQHDLLKK